ncbi:hypothetical protein KFE96_06205 [Kordiimonas sp. SCSIO 12603]|uniref:hypothetical protein n=1 Tax=Kordiimonas sp. SCSIO 12603 TaxID=2829596 RepID=UPI002105ECAE|nr:hypothetical protein [Kordiimonas sp. SCSIO 12603]UTW59892.1 hypothetical protein KFE96_06205 [Kordiimonas sp. SCSIO 12603]
MFGYAQLFGNKATIFLCSFIIAVSVFAPSSAHAQLPPKVQFDLALRQLEQAIENNQWSETLQVIKKLEDQGLELPAIMHYYKGRAYVETGKGLLATKALEAYLGTASDTDAKYTEALDLYTRATKRKEQQKSWLEADIKKLKSAIHNAESRSRTHWDAFRYIASNWPLLYELSQVRISEADIEYGLESECEAAWKASVAEAERKLQNGDYPKRQRKHCKKRSNLCNLVDEMNDYKTRGPKVCRSMHRDWVSTRYKYNEQRNIVLTKTAELEKKQAELAAYNPAQ